MTIEVGHFNPLEEFIIDYSVPADKEASLMFDTGKKTIRLPVSSRSQGRGFAVNHTQIDMNSIKEAGIFKYHFSSGDLLQLDKETFARGA